MASSIDHPMPATTWGLALQLQDPPKGPVSLRIARGIVQEIERGRLRPGDQLPGTRKLATQLGVHRKTIIAGFLELERQGWITSSPAKGTFVSLELPETAPEPQRLPARSSLPPLEATAHEQLILSGGGPELSILPRAALARAWRRALLGRSSARLLDHGNPRGEPRLRQALADLLIRNRGVRAIPDNLNVVRGTQHGIYLAVRALLQPGDCVAIEALHHPSLRGIFQLAGVKLLPVPLDDDGLDVDALDLLCTHNRVKAVYTTPHHQLPTSVTLSGQRRVRLLELARRRGLMVFEDDYDNEFQYEGTPVLPLAFSDRSGAVVYFGSMSAILAPGLRLGFIASSPEIAERIARYRTFVDQQGDQILESAVAELIEDGELERHVRRARRLYRARRDELVQALDRHVPGLVFDVPRGGMAIWVQAPGVDADAWARRAHAAGVSFQPASHFALEEPPCDFARLGFSACSEAQLNEAAQILGRTMLARG
ncbi:MAG TPA: PLP-dependent aminotransferase family protein [Myxococcales bacterium]|jgi:GntR family transcriptional regulator/MocR family aminotransferase|nr:PLP-dependent aminotransferase family protein [Myxococcales bacterium]